MLTTSSEVLLDQFLCHLKAHYHQPDTEAIEIVLSAVASHYVLDADPLWIFLEGPPGTGKTEMGIVPLKALPDVIPLGDITSNTFLSGWSDKGREGSQSNSLLIKGGSSIIFTIKDFTTLMSKKPDERAAIIGQIRELYDGAFSKHTGRGDEHIWQGKITFIAAVTPAIERQWALLRELGERFMTVRWGRGDGLALGRRAIHRDLSRHAVAKQSGELVCELMKRVKLVGKLGMLPEELSEPIVHMAEFGAMARGQIIRDTSSKREIIDVPQPEAPTRFSTALSNAVMAYALLKERRPIVEDLRIARRMMFDSVAHNRVSILEAIPVDAPISYEDIRKLTQMPASTIMWVGRELEALKLIQIAEVGGEHLFAYSDFGKQLREGFFPQHLSPRDER